MRASLLAPDGATTPDVPADIDAHTHLAARELIKSYGEHRVLDDITLTVSTGERLAIIGDNGAGKSTLLRILAGHLAPDAGTVACTTSRSLVEQELNAPAAAAVGDLLDETLAPARDAIAALEAATSSGHPPDGPQHTAEYAAALARIDRLDAWNAERRLAADLADFGAAGHDPATPLAALSPGQRYRLRLACALHHPGGVLLLDEPSNHLDDLALDRLAGRLLRHHGIVVLVTHDRWLLARVATRFFDLDPTVGEGGRAFTGTFDDYRRSRAGALQRWRDAYDGNVSETDRLRGELESAQERTPDAWRPEKGTGKHQRASRVSSNVRQLRRRIEQLQRQRPPIPPRPLRFELPPLPADHGDAALLAGTDLAVAGRLAPLEGPAIELAPGGRLLVTGPNGAGKSTLLAVLAGALDADDGERVVHPSTRIGWLHQEDALDPARTPLQHVAAAVPGLDDDALIDAMRGTGLLRDRDLVRPVGVLSVGQRRRVALAGVLLRQPSVLLLDEPTNHLSVTLVDELGDALLATPAAIVLVTHDRQLLHAARGWPQLTLAPAT